MAHGKKAQIFVANNIRLIVANNTATIDGGGVGLSFGSSFRFLDEGCTKECTQSMRGDGICDLPCMTRGCNW